MKKNKGFGLIGILIIIVAALAVGDIAYRVVTNSTPASQNTGVNNYQPQENQNNNVPSVPAQNNQVNNPANNSTTTTVTTTTTTTTPSIKVLSPNGGETWRAGTNQTATVNVTGDPIKIGNNVALFLENFSGNGNLSNGYSLGSYSISSVSGIKSFQVTLPTNYIGQDKIYATLNYVAPNGSCQPGYVGCVPAPVMQAYDYSDNYFNVTN